MTHVDWHPYPSERPTKDDEKKQFCCLMISGRIFPLYWLGRKWGGWGVEGVTAWAKMSGIDVSNLYPKTKPKKPGDYFVKLKNGYINTYLNNNVSMAYFSGTEFTTSDNDVIAWAEINYPEPYRPPTPLDNHPDAVTARKYMQNDPETLKKLGIFDE